MDVGAPLFPCERIEADVRFERAIDQVAEAIRRAVADGQHCLLVDATGVGFSPPSILDRLRFVRLWATASRGRVRVAVVARPEFIDSERFAVVAAAIFGLAAQVFDCEAAARAWLEP